jgi:hypothetical protein
MNKLKKVLRLLCLVILIIMASCGIGIVGNFLPNNKERYLDNEIKIEQIDNKDDKYDEESNKTKY